MSAARPKIANYPFTTLIPNLGVAEAGDVQFVVADVPGLIPGASEGKGLGHDFLRHVERCSALVHVLDCATSEPGRDPISDLDTIEAELSVYEDLMGPSLAGTSLRDRPRIVALNKIDVPEARDLADLVKAELEERGLAVYEVSAATTEGLRELKFAMAAIVEQARATASQLEPVRVVIRPKPVKDTGGFEIVRTKDGSYLIRGERPSRWVTQTDFTNDEAVGYLGDRLARLGVEEALAKAGAEPGDTVLIGDFDDAVVFDWDPELPAGGGHAAGPRGSDWRLEK